MQCICMMMIRRQLVIPASVEVQQDTDDEVHAEAGTGSAGKQPGTGGRKGGHEEVCRGWRRAAGLGLGALGGRPTARGDKARRAHPDQV